MEEKSQMLTLFEAALAKTGLKIQDVTKAIGMTKSGFYNAIRRETLTFNKMKQICRLLNVSVAYFDPEAHQTVGRIYFYDWTRLNPNADTTERKHYLRYGQTDCQMMMDEINKREESVFGNAYTA